LPTWIGNSVLFCFCLRHPKFRIMLFKQNLLLACSTDRLDFSVYSFSRLAIVDQNCINQSGKILSKRQVCVCVCVYLLIWAYS